MNTYSSQDLRARPEPTQLEDLSDASFVGKLLVLPANVRLDWKLIRCTNTLAYLASSSVTKEKNISTWPDGGSPIPDLSDERLIRRVPDENLHLDSDVERRI